jgi:hypothetical protein
MNPILVRFMKWLSNTTGGRVNLLTDENIKLYVTNFLKEEKVDAAEIVTWIDEERHSADLEAVLDRWRGKNVRIDIIIQEANIGIPPR